MRVYKHQLSFLCHSTVLLTAIFDFFFLVYQLNKSRLMQATDEKFEDFQ
jgi:hypothetical protein